jgi:hypothetical protein
MRLRAGQVHKIVLLTKAPDLAELVFARAEQHDNTVLDF